MNKKNYITGTTLPLVLFVSAFAASPLAGSRVLAETRMEQQQGILKGTVVDDKGEPVIGASVQVQGVKAGAITDIDGNFSIKVKPGTRLTISFIGYQTVTTEARPGMTVTLHEDTQMIQEVQVVAYGVQKKVTVTGAVASVKTEDLTRTPVGSVSNVLGGQMTGLTTVQYSGEPGSDAASIFVRGKATFGDSSPLIQVDGVERSMNDIDPNEIESITVLKDASATAVFGIRGANGVVLITTKRGAEGKAKISFTTSASILTPTKMVEQADSYDYATFYNRMRELDGMTPMFSDEIIQKFKDHSDPIRFPDTRWADYIMKDRTLQSQHNLSISGGTKTVRYFISAGAYTQGGLFNNFSLPYNLDYSYQRFNYRSNLDFTVTKSTTLQINLSGNVDNSDKPHTSQGASGMIKNMYYATPFSSPGIIDGRYIVTATDYSDLQLPFTGGTGMAYYGTGTNHQSNNKLNADLVIDQKLDFLTKGLSFKLKGSYNSDFTIYKYGEGGAVAVYTPVIQEDGSLKYRKSGENTDIRYSQKTGKGRDWYMEAGFNYARTFGDHSVSALVLYNQSKEYYYGSTYSDIPRGYVGLVGRATYDYKNRYMAEFNIGYNGSENFAPGKRFGFFPSVAAGWVVSNEPFWRAIKDKVNLLKFRVSYGLVGNDVISSEYADRFPYLTTVDMDQGYDVYIGTNHIRKYGPILSVYGNPDATWEESRKLDVGVEIGLFDSLNIIFDWFKEKRSGIFMQRASLPSSFGMSNITPWANIGKVDNRGVDISIDYNKAFSKDLILSLRGSFTYAHNEVVEMDEPAYKWDYLSKVGHPINSINCLIAEGLFQDEEEIASSPSQAAYATEFPLKPGDIKFKDLNGDRVIDDNDKCWYGNPTVPEIIYGFGFSLKYKGFDCSAFFQGQGKVSIIMYDSHPFGTKATPGGGLMQWMADEHWREEAPDPNARYPRLSPEWNTNNTQANSLYVRNGRMLRLKNAEIGYTYKFMRVYVSGTNLLTFSPFKYWDPEKGSGNGLSYPLQRTCNLGFQFTF